MRAPRLRGGIRVKKPSYRYFKMEKYKYHILSVELVDKTEFTQRLIAQSAQAKMRMPAAIQKAILEESKFFLVHIRVHQGKKTFNQSVRLPFELAKDELGAYHTVQKVLGQFSKLIKPKEDGNG